MPDFDRLPPPVATRAPAGGGLYFIVGAVVIAILVGDYLVLGTPGLHWPAPSTTSRNIDVVVAPR
jgi:hypothetical protein